MREGRVLASASAAAASQRPRRRSVRHRFASTSPIDSVQSGYGATVVAPSSCGVACSQLSLPIRNSTFGQFMRCGCSPQGLKAVRAGEGSTIAGEGVQRLVRRRMQGYPERMRAEMHHARCAPEKCDPLTSGTSEEVCGTQYWLVLSEPAGFWFAVEAFAGVRGYTIMDQSHRDRIQAMIRRSAADSRVRGEGGKEESDVSLDKSGLCRDLVQQLSG